MAIIGFNFTKILVEKKSKIKGKVDIKNNVSVKDVEATDIPIGTSKQNALKFIFEFTSDYSPSVGQILFNGDVLYVDDPAKQTEVLKNWKKNKQVPKETMSEILNTVLMRCNVEALLLSRDVNLPPPIPMPKVER
ncbi:hypothetical protein CMO88_00325 [Candidatus Woesearchaeota archaeon]|nr:hypothetical protein [Candidatus Woesearchaeota archaeon]|tara:strand:- start:60511 stop:60915 length:405 start_codon:yes stop_codon:yes gene_type:complete